VVGSDTGVGRGLGFDMWAGIYTCKQSRLFGSGPLYLALDTSVVNGPICGSIVVFTPLMVVFCASLGFSVTQLEACPYVWLTVFLVYTSTTTPVQRQWYLDTEKYSLHF
jgi:hypothetical protein